jgi:hypothetical protein
VRPAQSNDPNLIEQPYLQKTFSAALDPEAEYGKLSANSKTDIRRIIALFERMLELRGQRTMIFSSHRFGKLTKYADMIL